MPFTNRGSSVYLSHYFIWEEPTEREEVEGIFMSREVTTVLLLTTLKQ